MDGVADAVAGARMGSYMLEFCCDVLWYEHVPLAWWWTHVAMMGDATDGSRGMKNNFFLLSTSISCKWHKNRNQQGGRRGCG